MPRGSPSGNTQSQGAATAPGRVLPSGVKSPGSPPGRLQLGPPTGRPRTPPRAACSGRRAAFRPAATRFKRANRRARREGGPERSPRLGL